ncbi:MAG: tetratricopeptide repeat protein, partial [Candidatus Hodarchaeota archaeon]
ECFEQGLPFFKELENKQDIAKCLNNIGLVHHQKGELDLALQYYQQTLAVDQALDNKEGIATSLNNIGAIYRVKGDLDLALECLNQSLILREKIGNKQDIARSLNNIGNIYRQEGNMNLALEYYQQSLELFKELGNKQEIAGSFNNIGNVYREKGDINLALESHQLSLAEREKIGNEQEIAESLKNLGNTYWNKGDLNKATEYLEQSLAFFERLGNNFYIAEILFYLISVALERNVLEETQSNMEQTDIYLNQLKAIHHKESNKIISQQYQLIKALILNTSDEKSKKLEAQKCFQQIIQEEVVSYELTILARLNLCRLLFERFVFTGTELYLKDLQTQLTNILTLARQSHLQGVILAILLLQGKLDLLQFNLPEAHSLFQQVKSEAQAKGFEGLEYQCQKEFTKLQKYKTLEVILEMTEAEKDQFRQQQTEGIVDYLKRVALQLQAS